MKRDPALPRRWRLRARPTRRRIRADLERLRADLHLARDIGLDQWEVWK